MHQQTIKSSLLEIGCSSFEIEIYQHLLQKPQGITNIANHLGVQREKIYLAIEQMEKKGLLQKPAAYSRQLSVYPPSHLLTLLKIKLAKTNKTAQELNTILPDLLFGDNSKQSSKQIAVGKGENEFLTMFDFFIKEAKKDIVCFSNPVLLHQVIDMSFLKYWIKHRLNKNIHIRILIKKENEYVYGDDEELVSNAKYLRETRTIMTETAFQGTFYVSGTLVILCDPITLQIIKVDNIVIAQTLLALFENSWQNSTKSG
jgi:sugar-specific transcriptional regulator TrmB